MEGKRRRLLTVGILAHVDAGKTTLSESMLYLSGQIRKAGRVDHGDTFLDTHPLERERGITIFSKQARFSRRDLDVVLLDTPGHVDFSAETERTLGVLDYAILVVSGTDGVQNHTLTLWQLLRTYRVPTFIFVNKTDLPTRTPLEIAEELRARLDPGCFPVLEGEDKAVRDERFATTCENLLESFLENGSLSDGEIASEIAREIAERRLFPCFFGSALRMQGVDAFLDALVDWTLSPVWEDGFDTRTCPDQKGAKVYKIGYDGNLRLTWLKVTAGALSVRDEIAYVGEDGQRRAEKIAQIRLYSGDRYATAEICRAGEICTVTGLSATYAGLGIGAEPDNERPVLEPVMTYRLVLPEGCDADLLYPKLKRLEEEDPALHLTWHEVLREIHVGLMGEVQIDVLKRLIRERFGIEVGVDAGRILYKETLSHAAEGVGHFEPLRHYAEVHLLLEPMPRGTGLIFETRCSENLLDRNWQRLILTNLAEKTHLGVLTGAPLTDLKITLVAGRAHLKHTEGGDFREATWRAVRQGLLQVPSVLLEPWYRYELEVPTECVGRAMADLQTRSATFDLEEAQEGFSRLTGRGPVAELNGYVREVVAYSHGKGRFFCTPDGYAPCHNPEEIVAAAGYDPVADLANTPDSVFCAHGAGFNVGWDHVRAYMHIDSGYTAQGKRTGQARDDASADPLAESPLRSARALAKAYRLSEEELETIMLREFGPMKRRRYAEPKTVAPGKSQKTPPARKRMLIVDGYNLIFAWDYFADLAKESLEKAREALMDTLSNYVGYTKCDLVLVFDAYRVGSDEARAIPVPDGNDVGGRSGAREFEHDGYRVVFTGENQTGDAYIEKLIHQLGASFSVRVVTSDALIQSAAVTVGILRMSSREFVGEVEKISAEITEFIRKME